MRRVGGQPRREDLSRLLDAGKPKRGVGGLTEPGAAPDPSWVPSARIVPLLAAIASAVSTEGCLLLAPFAEATPEVSAAACSDGIDDDLDGLVDCNDPDCRCNRCGEVEQAEETPLGRVCTRDCECVEGEVCNPRRGLCIPAIEPLEENRFRVSFRLDIEALAHPADGRSNFLGGARLEGERFDFTEVGWGSSEVSFSTASEDQGRRVALVLQPFPAFGARIVDGGREEVFGPVVGEARSYVFDDNLLRVSRERKPTALRNILSLVLTEQGLLEPLGRIETSTLSFEPLLPGREEVWRGTFEGELREVSSLDRAREQFCPAETPVYFPDSDECEAVSDVPDVLYLGCIFDRGGSPDEGIMSYWVRPFWREGTIRNGDGSCVARRRSTGEIELRALGGSFAEVWMLEARMAEEQAVTGKRFGLDGLEDAVLHRLRPGVTRNDLTASIFDIDLTAGGSWTEESRAIRGSFSVEFISRAGNPRILGWIAAAAYLEE